MARLECPARIRGDSGCGRCKYTGGSTSTLCISMQKVYQFRLNQRLKQNRTGPEAVLSQVDPIVQPETGDVDKCGRM